MLFHTWPFLIFMLVVLPVFFALRKTPLWVPWLMAASYFFYNWWRSDWNSFCNFCNADWHDLRWLNPYLLLVFYSTGLDYLLVMLMDHCPQAGQAGAGRRDRVLTAAFGLSAALGLAMVGAAMIGPTTLRPTSEFFAVLVLLMAVGAWFANRRIWLVISIVNNLAILLFFKYAGFIAENLNQVLAWLDVSYRLTAAKQLMPYHLEYALPVGISFFTFQSMSYTIDFYLGKVPRERNFLRFATFVCFFPQLMAGPIERAKHLLPQLQNAPPVRLQNLTDGLSLFLVGLFKKLALANYLALYVERVYDNPAASSGAELVLGTFAFAWQIFFDFSGYTDMARGVARMMGFHLILNFNNPYLATGLGDFWSRWHISLSTWFRDYVYIPLGGNRRGALATYRNLFITFLVSGIWHGANWTFAIWGVLHALGVMLTRELERSAFYRDRVPAVFKQAWVFAYVCFAWVFFRATSLADALLIIRRVGTAAWGSPQIPALMLLLVATVWLYQFAYESRLRGVLGLGSVHVALAVGMMLYLCLCASGGGTFIYFQF
jgi:alginate O-acetyltransferase complex protein AlgI